MRRWEATKDEVAAEDLALGGVQTSVSAKMMTLAGAEYEHIRAVVDACGGNKTQACRILGIGRGTLYSKLRAD